MSVVIPVKNDAADLERCLEALAPQLADVDELIVVDNGSVDASSAVAARYGARVVHVDGGGIPAASAAGYDATSGSVIARLDADCVPGPKWLDFIRAQFGNSLALDGLTGPARFIDGPRLLRGILAVLYLGAYFGSLYLALARVPLFGSNCAFRRSVWQRASETVHRRDPEVHDDLDLSFHLAPWTRVQFSTRMVMGMSMRPLFDRAAFGRRFRRGAHTVAIHWPHEFPWYRWARRISHAF